ncbi:hypothetical protein SXCC_00889 [Gluconacetobacter sp. SXCC-1]|nr:hypothetical protein SXCC_00889 [Gluconacetobacter sp. SXCC-1]
MQTVWPCPDTLEQVMKRTDVHEIMYLFCNDTNSICTDFKMPFK